MIFSAAFSFSLLSSFLMAIGIVSTQRMHGHLSMDSQTGVQKLHKAPTPRVGGIALAFGAVVGGVNLPYEFQTLWWMLCIAALPAFAFGLAEDLTKRVGVKIRLVATICTGLMFSLLTGYQITRVDIPGLDWILAFSLPALLFTAFAIGGVANAINIIDGVNGLASGSAIIILSGFGIVAWQMNDMQVLGICLVVSGVLAGFFLLNFPMGRLFLGDAGAYSVGFILAAIAIALPQRNAELSPLIGLLALSYPVIETMASIHRRLVREGTHPGQADRLHLHSLVYRSSSLRLAQILRAPHLRNPLTSIIVWTLPLMSVALMVFVGRNSGLVLLSTALVAVVYILLYRRVALLRVMKSPINYKPETEAP